MMRTTVKEKEIKHFQNDSKNWWQETGPFAPLHQLNPVRLRFIRDAIDSSLLGLRDRPEGPRFSLHGQMDPRIKSEGLNKKLSSANNHLSGLDILDIGCGGGLTCEPLARLGASVTGIDADEQAIKVAQAHATSNDLSITYEAEPVETHLKRVRTRYDVVLALEIIEHVDHPDEFVTQVVQACKPGGLIIMSTLNKTIKSLVLGVWAAEYVLGWVPPGTHDWHQFVKPSTLNKMMQTQGCTAIDAAGIVVDPLTRGFKLSRTDLDVNYMMAFRKNA